MENVKNICLTFLKTFGIVMLMFLFLCIIGVAWQFNPIVGVITLGLITAGIVTYLKVTS